MGIDTFAEEGLEFRSLKNGNSKHLNPQDAGSTLENTKRALINIDATSCYFNKDLVTPPPPELGSFVI